MEETVNKYWPSSLPKSLSYRLGERPLHEYVKENAKKKPEKNAYNFYGRKLSWKEFGLQIDRFVGFLKNRGVQKGDRIGLYLQNCPQYIIAHYAIGRLAAIVVPINPMYKESELEYVLNEAEVKGVIAGQELYERLTNINRPTSTLQFIVTTCYADYLPEHPTLPLPRELIEDKHNFDDTADMKEILDHTAPISESSPIDIWEDIGLMVFTSGTTGRPKAAMLPFVSALFKTAATSEVNQVKEDDRALAVAPLCHIAGMVMGVNLPVYRGCECVLLTRFDTEAAISAIEKYRITTWYSIAPMNAAIINAPEVAQRDLTSLKRNLATSFGIPVTKELARKWSHITDGCLLYEAAYGLSETHTCDTFMPVDHIKYGSCGIPTYETQIKILDPFTSEVLPPDEQGEIVIKNPGVFKGYLNRPEATSETLKDGWVHTGDIGMLDKEGYLFFSGRIKEMIKCSGYSVFPEDVESLLNEHEGVLQSAVIGVPDEVRGESVKAFIVLKPSIAGKVTEQEMIDWAKDKMAAYKYPRCVEFREELPSTSSGKVLRRKLKD
ncbi:AMP-binding protein [Halobacillus amylolyticus]|uniref:AMP-binding protein n=1 Tax=Halobacillus amylolyticus TaxID=2932259 RepID=A0ABY4H7Y8_9BACI|nr:AMP-binding protein [Halobacillus amylolyticus]UOR10558.1 AMP-binding protein [Halobacillus amylolyticus]